MKQLLRRLPGGRAPDGDRCSAMVASLSTFYPDERDRTTREHVNIDHALLAKVRRRSRPTPTRSRSASRSSTRRTTSTIENFLHMMFAVPSEPYEVDPDDRATRSNQLLILHADHEQNCSHLDGAHGRLAASANLFASIAAGICALWGPLHGGANQAVIEMLERIQDDGGDVQDVRRSGQGQDDSSFRLMGFGHRVYKNFDPRATHPQEDVRRGARRARHQRPAARHREAARRGRAQRRVLHRAQALPERRLLLAASSTARWASRPTCSR